MAAIVRALPAQGRAHYAPRDELADRRDRQVHETVAYAAVHVPFYRDLFRREGLDPLEIRGAEDLARLPIVSRADVLRDPALFRADTAGDDGVMLRSTGTSGVPLELFHDRRSVLLNVAYAERERAVESRLVGKRLRYTRLYLGSDHPENVDRVRRLMAQSSFRPLRPRYARATLDHFDRAHEAIERIRPDVVMGSGSHLEAFYRTAAAEGTAVHRPKALLYTWDHMSAAGRELIEESFGIRVISRYSAMESLKIGFTCEERNGFHLHEDLCHVTVVDRAGQPLADGEPGELVLSNLVNRGSVLLNYRIGDLGRITSELCACGRTTRRLAELEGRVSEYIALPDGSLVGPFPITVRVGSVPGVVHFQLVQQAPTTFELRLATVDEAAFAEAAPLAVAGVRELLPDFEIDAVYVEEIPIEPGRKHRPIVLLP
jgi:phenylacetate-CoA ligase